MVGDSRPRAKFGFLGGLKSKKLLFLGVRNRYCSVCTVAEHKGQTSPEHNCYRNWSGSSYAMESDVVAEGFWLSELTHGARYLKLVGDGDSSVMSTILQSVQYGSYMYVEKIKCANHAVKCYPSRLEHLVKVALSSEAMKVKRRRLSSNWQLMPMLPSGITVKMATRNSSATIWEVGLHMSLMAIVTVVPPSASSATLDQHKRVKKIMLQQRV